MNTLLVLVGPTGVGKTEWSLQIAESLEAPIISADSRQLYKGLTIGTAAPTAEQLARVKHYQVAVLDPKEYYSASEYEQSTIPLIHKLHQEHPVVVLTGGSMMYVDAICDGIDKMPTIDPELRKNLQQLYQEQGLDPIRRKLKLLDPVYYDQVDLKNRQRVMHAVEVWLMSGKPYSSFRTNHKKKRDFRIIKVGLNRPREELYERINLRVDQMIADGLIEEAKGLYDKRHLNSLNTVGYKEIFNFLDGEWSLDHAIDKIKQHSRNYARKQLSWFRRDKNIHWIDLSDSSTGVIKTVTDLVQNP